MSFLKNEDHPRVCPKTGKIIQSNRNFRWPWWLFPFTGLAALIWFLVRVIPKPSRAAYPCQRLAFPLASGFITWIIGLAASVIAFQKAKRHFVRARYVLAAICIVISVTAIYVALSYSFQYQTLAAYSTPSARIPQATNSPIGTGKGVHPGRVAWIHDPNATTWAGIGDGNYYDPTHTDQNIVNAMVSKSLRALTGKSSDFAAWDAIFRNFNEQQGKGNVGYQPGEKIMIKVNLVGLIGSLSYTYNNTNYLNYPNTSPQVMHAVLDQLVNVVGVNDVDIAIGDTVCTFVNAYYNKLYTDFPHATYIDVVGTTGRTKTTAPSTNPRVYWADPNSNSATSKDYVPNSYKNAAYVINLANLKGHYNQAGITVCGKNHYGTLCRTPNQANYYDLHSTQIWTIKGMGHYRPLVDLMGHPHIGGKTVLYLVDGLYTIKHCRYNVWPGTAEKFPNPPFNNDWPSSFLASQDPLAIDSVAFDILYYQWPDVDGPGGDGSDDYLHEAALAPASPSGVSYDPDGDGNALTSQGVHEHWNNNTDMQYTRNLGTGKGIELVTAASAGWPDLTDDWFVDFKDFAIFAKAWRSISGEGTYDPCCDMSLPADGVINEKDLYVLCDNWLTLLTNDVVLPGATIQQVYSASGIFFEGATWDTNSNKFFFTKRTSGYQILRLDSPGSATVWMNSAPATNGMVLSLDGRLLTADEDIYQIRSHRIGASGAEDTVVLGTTPKKPNDLVELLNGDIYYTCPDWNGVPASGQGIYLLEPNGVSTRVNNILIQPNGIITSLDETKLYVAESSSSNNTYKRWWVFPINSNGTLGTGSVFFKPANTTGMGTTDPDGMTIDERGNLYFTGLGGVWVVSPTGQELKRIPIPYQPSNICFGGPDGKTLYITCQDKVYSLAMLVRGGE